MCSSIPELHGLNFEWNWWTLTRSIYLSLKFFSNWTKCRFCFTNTKISPNRDAATIKHLYVQKQRDIQAMEVLTTANRELVASVPVNSKRRRTELVCGVRSALVMCRCKLKASIERLSCCGDKDPRGWGRRRGGGGRGWREAKCWLFGKKPETGPEGRTDRTEPSQHNHWSVHRYNTTDDSSPQELFSTWLNMKEMTNRQTYIKSSSVNIKLDRSAAASIYVVKQRPRSQADVGTH